MAAATQALPSVPSREHGLDGDSSNISSPLSDVEDKDGETPDITMAMDNDAIARDDSDSDSNLSDIAETEAETERLFDTPRVQRQRDVTVDEFNDDRVFEHSPSTLRKAGSPLEETHEDDVELSDVDRPSPPSQPTADESPAKPDQSHDSPVSEESKDGSQDRKRKRSVDPDAPGIAEHANKRPASDVPSGKPEQDDDVTMADDGAPPASVPADQVTTESSNDPAHRQDDVPIEEEAAPRETRGSRKNTRNGNRRNVLGHAEEAEGDNSASGVKGREADAESVEHRIGEEGVEREEEAEHVNKSVEEAERKQAAYEELTSIDGMFGLFTDRLYKDRLERLEEEEKSLSAEVPYHPEYLNMMQCIDERLNKKLAQFKREHEYQLEALERIGAAQRSQIWNQFYQEVRGKREETLDALNRQFYDIQAARRSAHSHPDQILIFPKDPAQRTKNAFSYNAEVSTLSAIAKYEGFPAAPSMRGATVSEVDDDLEAIKRAKRARQQPVTAPAAAPAAALAPPLEGSHKLNVFPRTLDPAGERFIQENAWANPKHPAHKMLPPGERRSTPKATGTAIGLPPAAAGMSTKPLTNGHGSPGPSSAPSVQPGQSDPRPVFYGIGIRMPDQVLVPPTSELTKPGSRVAAGN